MKKDTSILFLFSKSDCQSSIKLLVEISYKIALPWLRLNFKKISKIIFSGDLTFEEVAISSIAPLFCKESVDQPLPIIKEFNSWQPPIKTEDDAIFFLNRLIAGRAEQHITRLLKEQDPFFAKILDSVKYLIRKNGYKKVSYFGKRYITESTCEKIEGKVIDQDTFEKLPAALFRNRKNLLSDIFEHLANETEFFPAIPLNTLVLKLRSLNSKEIIMQSSGKDMISNFDIDEEVNYGLSGALDKLRISYCENGKLTDCESEIFKKTLTDLANDLRDGGINRGLYEYLLQHMQNLNKQEYHDKYHNILEYLLKVMKNRIRESLLEDDK